MQEFWATATVHHHSIRFKMTNKKHIVNLKYFREMLQICLRIPNQQFDELPFEAEILTFLRELGHSGEIKMITDVEHKDAKKSNKMYYPHFTKIIVNFFMTKDQSIPMRNKVNCHFSRDDHMLTTIKLVSRHQISQQYRAILPIELTNEAIRNSESYKEYYAIASGAEPPKTKASVRKKQVSSDTTMPPPTAKGKRLKTSAKVDKPTKDKQPAKVPKAKGLTGLSEVALTKAEQMKLATKRSLTQTHISHASGSSVDEGTGIILGVLDVSNYKSDDKKISWKSSEEDDDDEVNMSDDDVDNQNNDGDDFIHPKFSTHDDEDKEEESFDPIVQTPSHDEKTDDEDNDEDSHEMNVEGDEMDDEGENEEDDANNLYIDVNINPEGQDIQMADVQITQVIEDTHVTLTLANLEDLPNFGSLFGFDHRLKALEINFSEFMQINQFAKAISLILGIADKYLDHRMNEAVKVAAQLQSDRLRYEAQKQAKPPNPDRPWNKTLPATHGPIQPWISNLARKHDSRTSFNELIDTPLDFSAFVMNRLKVDTLTPELLAGPTYELMKGSCKSLVELEFFLEEVYKATTDQLDWNNPKGQEYPHDMRKPLPLIPTSWGHLIIPFDHFINNDLNYLRGGVSSRMESARDNYSKHRIIAVTELQIVELHNYKHLDWITVRSHDDKLYKFKEGDFKRLRIQDIEEMLLLLVQGKLTNLTIDECLAFNVSL
nr:hypothetical protein [Tanacetum cinerariifolium]